MKFNVCTNEGFTGLVQNKSHGTNRLKELSKDFWRSNSREDGRMMEKMKNVGFKTAIPAPLDHCLIAKIHYLLLIRPKKKKHSLNYTRMPLLT